MKTTFSHLFIRYEVETPIIGPAHDRTQVTRINILGPDGVRVSINELFGEWEIDMTGMAKIGGLTREQVDGLLRGYIGRKCTEVPFLPVDEIIDRHNQQLQEWEEDPMTIHYGGMRAIV